MSHESTASGRNAWLMGVCVFHAWQLLSGSHERNRGHVWRNLLTFLHACNFGNFLLFVFV